MAGTGGSRPGAGRPKKEHLATFRELVEASVTPSDFEAMVRAMVQRAKEGDARAFAQIMDRYYGRATEHVITEQVGDAAPIRIVFEEKPRASGE
jgi:hypothetical protein